MKIVTAEQVKKIFRIVAGCTLLSIGVIMLVTPGPGWLIIFLGLSLLSAEFLWARRLKERIKRGGVRIKDVVIKPGKEPSEGKRRKRKDGDDGSGADWNRADGRGNREEPAARRARCDGIQPHAGQGRSAAVRGSKDSEQHRGSLPRRSGAHDGGG